MRLHSPILTARRSPGKQNNNQNNTSRGGDNTSRGQQTSRAQSYIYSRLPNDSRVHHMRKLNLNLVQENYHTAPSRPNVQPALSIALKSPQQSGSTQTVLSSGATGQTKMNSHTKYMSDKGMTIINQGKNQGNSLFRKKRFILDPDIKPTDKDKGISTVNFFDNYKSFSRRKIQ